MVTSPDNSFLPGGSTPSATSDIRGVAAVVAQGGRTIEIPTGQVVVDIYAQRPPRGRGRRAGDGADQRDRRTAAQLPARLPDTGFAEQPLPVQMPSPLHALR